MKQSGFYDRSGSPMAFAAWVEAIEDDATRLVASTTVGDGHVSTVWLGIDFSHGTGRKLIFESLVSGGKLDGERHRYSTEAEAQEGHARLVEQLAAREEIE